MQQKKNIVTTAWNSKVPLQFLYNDKKKQKLFIILFFKTLVGLLAAMLVTQVFILKYKNIINWNLYRQAICITFLSLLHPFVPDVVSYFLNNFLKTFSTSPIFSWNGQIQLKADADESTNFHSTKSK